ncbi:hypothetical protein L596_028672 [Steinernema carpocapsae]|uniref:Uncharacterized protein n=1 Tax=Steinernema carpocapsae TaxID=34508 RepID=A0A4U5LZ42_STECR|nr:hypothetical protein L596_028672 [Steinernema carpocapsae]
MAREEDVGTGITGILADYKEFIDLDESKREKKPAKEAFGSTRQSLARRQQILQLQKAFAAVESCQKPVLAAVHGQCLGGGVGLLGACDVRLASATVVFALKEIEIAASRNPSTQLRILRS